MRGEGAPINVMWGTVDRTIKLMTMAFSMVNEAALTTVNDNHGECGC